VPVIFKQTAEDELYWHSWLTSEVTDRQWVDSGTATMQLMIQCDHQEKSSTKLHQNWPTVLQTDESENRCKQCTLHCKHN